MESPLAAQKVSRTCTAPKQSGREFEPHGGLTTKTDAERKEIFHTAELCPGRANRTIANRDTSGAMVRAVYAV
jgi:hypothetical protein